MSALTPDIIAAIIEKHGPSKTVIAASKEELAPASSAQNTSMNLGTLNSILASGCLSPDVGAGSGKLFDPFGRPTEEYWFAALMAVASLQSDEAKEIFRDWSKGSDRYVDDADFDKEYAKWKPDHPNPLRFGSFVKFAKTKGWQDPRYIFDGSIFEIDQSGSETHNFQLLGREAISELKPPSWAVKNIFPAQGIAAFYGPSGSGKTFAVFDMACAIADGKYWFGYKTKKLPVAFLMLEGSQGLKPRADAWEKQNNRPIPDGIRFCTDPFDLTNKNHIEKMAGQLSQGCILIIDTLNQASAGLDENSSKDMGLILANSQALMRKTNGLVILVHHTGKDTAKGLRGHSSLGAAIDASIEVKRTRERRSWTTGKVKDGPDHLEHAFKLNVHVVGVDEDGDEITSCAIERDSSLLFKQKEPSGPKQRDTLHALKKKLGESPHKGKASAPSETNYIVMADAIDHIASNVYASEDRNKRRNRAKKSIQDLITGGFISAGEHDDGDIWIWRES
jgi:hypothetical protein